MALTDNLNAYYKFDNGAITTDSVGAYTLTNEGTVASSASGKIGYGADFGSSGTTKKLSRTDNMGLAQAPWTCNFWVNFASLPGTNTQFDLFHIRNTTSSNNRLSLNLDYRNESGTYKWNLNIAGVENKVTQTVSTGTYYMVTIGWNGTNFTIDINNSNIITTVRGAGADAANDTSIGNYVGNSRQLFGLIDELGIWSKALSAGEKTSLYNSGNGIQYPFVSGPANLKSYNTNAKANIKTINTNAIANCKTLNTNA